MTSTPDREQGVVFAMSVLRTARDWQAGEHALAEHPVLGPWLRHEWGEDANIEARSIIREAERRLGESLPY